MSISYPCGCVNEVHRPGGVLRTNLDAHEAGTPMNETDRDGEHDRSGRTPQPCGPAPDVNTEPFGGFPPGTLQIGEPVRNRDGTWTVPLIYRAGGRGDDTADDHS